MSCFWRTICSFRLSVPFPPVSKAGKDYLDVSPRKWETIHVFDSFRPLCTIRVGCWEKTKPHRTFLSGCIVTTQMGLATPGAAPSSKRRRGGKKKKQRKGKREKDHVSCSVLTRAFGPNEGNTPFMAFFMRTFLFSTSGIQSFPLSAWFPEITGKQCLITTFKVAVDRTLQ